MQLFFKFLLHMASSQRQKQIHYSESLLSKMANRLRLVVDAAVVEVSTTTASAVCCTTSCVCIFSSSSLSLFEDSELMMRRRFWEPTGIGSSATRLALLLLLANISTGSAKSSWTSPPSLTESVAPFRKSILERKSAAVNVEGMRQNCSYDTVEETGWIVFSQTV